MTRDPIRSMTKAMNANRGVGMIAMLAVLAGCANPVARHYVASGDAGQLGLGATAAVEIRMVASLPDEEARLRREGWREIGRAAFQDTGTLNRAQLVAQARAVGADLVLWHGWSMEEQREGVVIVSSDTDPSVAVPGRPGESPTAPAPAIRRSREIHTVTVTRFTISFWRKTEAKPPAIEHE